MLNQAIVGGGCFWCIQGLFQRVKGVKKVESGYAGGHKLNPTYNDVCSGNSGHTEVVRVLYDSNIIPYHDLLLIFMNMHHPTFSTKTQYQSIIMYQTEQEMRQAKKVIAEMQEQKKEKIATVLVKATQFYLAEQRHQNYYQNNPNQSYCMKPKVEKLSKLFEKYII